MNASVCLLFLVATLEWHVIASLRCYKCTANEPESDCETDVESLPPRETILQCKPHQKYCTVRRVELNRRKGKVLNLYRSCETIPDFINKVIVDDTYTTYFAACQSDLCNSGDGTKIVVAEENNNYDKPKLPTYQQLRWGTNSAHTLRAHLLLSLIVTVVCHFLIL